MCVCVCVCERERERGKLVDSTKAQSSKVKRKGGMVQRIMIEQMRENEQLGRMMRNLEFSRKCFAATGIAAKEKSQS